MDLRRTPEDRFAAVPSFPYEPEYVSVSVGDYDDVRMAYVDVGEGPETILCLHGEPTWSFLYRTMIPRLSEVGRVVVPDFPGFGRSDKLPEDDDYSFFGQYDALVEFIETLDLERITLVGQDWGGILGLLAATREQERFARIVPMNTGLPDGTQDMPEAWVAFRDMVASTPDLDVGRLVNTGCVTDLDDDVVAAYDAPFPDQSYKTGVRAWPMLVPTDTDDQGAAALARAKERLREWDKPAFVLFGDSDPIFRESRTSLRELIPTASEQPDVWVEDGGHFLQEDAGREIADHVADFINRTQVE